MQEERSYVVDQRGVTQASAVFRKNGTPVNTEIVITCGEGILRSKDANLLVANDGTISLSKD